MAAAGTPWWKSYCSRNHHPKTLALAKEINRTRHEALGILDDLFSSAITYWPDGDLAGVPDLDIERTCGWHGVKGRLTAGLAAVGWLDGESGHRVVHNLAEENGSYKRAEKQKKLRRRRKEEAGRVALREQSRSATVPLRGEEKRGDQQQQEATTQPPVPEEAAPAEVVVVESAPVPVPADLLPATTTPEPAVETPATVSSEPQGPGPQFEPEDASQAPLHGESWKPASGARTWGEYHRWMTSQGICAARSDNSKCENLFDSLAPLSDPEMRDSVRAMREEGVVPNGGLALWKIKRAREKRELEESRRHPAFNSETEADRGRRRALEEARKAVDWDAQQKGVAAICRSLGDACAM